MSLWAPELFAGRLAAHGSRAMAELARDPSQRRPHQIGEHRWKATNSRGGGVSIGPGDDPDFTPVELLLAALAGCGATDLD